MARVPGLPKVPSPTRAAELVCTTSPVPLTPSRRVVLREAARLWCRDLAFPTARELARAVGRAPSTVLIGFESMVRIHSEIIRRECDRLDSFRRTPDLEWVPQLYDHARRLSARDPVLLRLPSMVDATVAERERGDRVSTVAPAFPIALHVLAAFAEPGTTLLPYGHFERLIVAVAQALPTTGGKEATTSKEYAA